LEVKREAMAAACADGIRFPLYTSDKLGVRKSILLLRKANNGRELEIIREVAIASGVYKELAIA
jgi:hypothetical protein